MKETIDVLTGEVKAGVCTTILRSTGIGSCVAVAAFAPGSGVGVLAHIMLPGRAPKTHEHQATRYAADAIETMISLFEKHEVKKNAIAVCLVGGGNVLKREDDTTGEAVLESIERILIDAETPVVKRAVGGFERRAVILDIENESVYFSEGDGKPQLLWQSQ